MHHNAPRPSEQQTAARPQQHRQSRLPSSIHLCGFDPQWYRTRPPVCLLVSLRHMQASTRTKCRQRRPYVQDKVRLGRRSLGRRSLGRILLYRLPRPCVRNNYKGLLQITQDAKRFTVQPSGQQSSAFDSKKVKAR